MKIKRINAEKWETPYCVMRLEKLYLDSRTTRKEHKDPGKCQRYGFYFVDGKPYCRQHAGALAIIYIMEN